VVRFDTKQIGGNLTAERVFEGVNVLIDAGIILVLTMSVWWYCDLRYKRFRASRPSGESYRNTEGVKVRQRSQQLARERHGLEAELRANVAETERTFDSFAASLPDISSALGFSTFRLYLLKFFGIVMRRG
jgi:hypothetical protein